MTVRIQCKCGKEFNVPEERASKPFKCFVCQRDVIASAEVNASPTVRRPATPIGPESAGGDPGFGIQVEPVQPKDQSSAQPQTPIGLGGGQTEGGPPKEEILRQLVQDSFGTIFLAEAARKVQAQALLEAGKKNMLFGALWCAGGIAITVLTYFLAANLGGGKYLVAVGPMLFGGYQFFKGLSQIGGQEADPGDGSA
jgi:hypothetical protein